MKHLTSVILLISIFLCLSCQTFEKHDTGKSLIKKLQDAENSKDLKNIEEVLADSIILYTSDLMPINGKSAVVSIYSFIFTKQEVEFVEYITDSAYKEKYYHIEEGISIIKKAGQNTDTNEFKAIFQEIEGEYKILELCFGAKEDLKLELPKLPKPTGIYNIAQATFFYDSTESDNGRILSFQVWYPTEKKSGAKAIYKSKEVVAASTNFTGIPIFMVNYFSLIESNSFVNASAFPNKTFPILLYNHGYGGFTSVYQTVFEDLASHGYIVVSIGHQNESSLLIKNDGHIIATNPQNEFYAKRPNELQGAAINELQSIILNSDNLDANKDAYLKLVALSPLHNESTRLWKSDTESTLLKLREINISDQYLRGAFNFESIGAFGHSVGGATSGQLGIDNSLINTGINLDGFQFGDMVYSKLEVPFMFVASNQQGNSFLRNLSFIHESESDCYQVAIKGFSHGSFTDLDYFLKGNTRSIKIQRQLILSFFNKYLKGEEFQMSDLETIYPELIIL